MISLINVAGFLLGLYFLLRSYLLIRAKKEDVADFLVWSMIGVSLLVLTVFPQVGDALADYLNIRTRTSTIFAVAIFLLYLILFRLNALNRNLDRQISTLNEEIALLKYERESELRRSTQDTK